ncbi:NADH:flavin oxidoreductase, partial [Chloroflexota bacterium]
MVTAFGQAAVRAREAGFDGLEIHAAHLHLISAFLCPYTNRRTDRYGNGFDGRARFLVEIIREIRKSVGRDYPVSCRLDGNEPIENGVKIEDCKKIARAIEQEGVDAISISNIAEFLPVERDGRNYLQLTSVPGRKFPEGCFVDYASQVKQSVKIPVITVGKIFRPEMAERILQEQKADLVAVGRGLVADPLWARKAREGQSDKITYCSECRDCVKTAVQQLIPIECSLWRKADGVE